MNIDPQQLVLLIAIGISTIATVIGVIKGNIDQTLKAQKETVKLINKLQKKHSKTEKRYIKEEQQLKKLKENNKNESINNIQK